MKDDHAATRVYVNLRLVSGLVMMVYVLGHMGNHMVGAVSVDAAESVRKVLISFWRSPLMYWVIPTALGMHITASAWAILRRRTLRMPPREIVQVVFGFLIPVPLFGHIAQTRYVYHLRDTELSYLQAFLAEPYPSFVLTAIMVLLVWIHACIGLYRWLHIKPFFESARPWLFAAAIVYPLFTFFGTFSMAREVTWRTRDPLSSPRMESFPVPDNMRNDVSDAFMYVLVGSFFLTLAVGFALRAIIRAQERRRASVTVSYDTGEKVRVFPGTTVLEASRLGGIPHASICGGRGRCSTCRVRVMLGNETLPPAEEQERRILDRIAAPPSVRLACVIAPTKDVYVAPLLHKAGVGDTRKREAYVEGRELNVAVLFSDLRGFTKLSHKRLPYDVVFVLNQYFESMGEAIELHGGHLDKFIGDGIMAIFGIRTGPESGARDALLAAAEMSSRLDILNLRLQQDLEQPLKIGIGIHLGPAIIGEMGYRAARSLTAIGDTVNTASRLESLTKDRSCELVVSREVVNHAGIDLSAYATDTVQLRGRDSDLDICIIPRASEIARGGTRTVSGSDHNILVPQES